MKMIQLVIMPILLNFSGSMLSLYGSFKGKQFDQTLKISIVTKNFLKTMIEQQQSFIQKRPESGKKDQSCVLLVKKMNQVYRNIVNQGQIDSLIYSTIHHENELLKKELVKQESFLFFSQPEAAWFEWFAIVQQAVAQLHIYSRNNDLSWLQQQLKLFEQIIHSHSWDNAMLQKIVLRVFDVSNEIMNLFDGTFVDEFDWLVLSNLILVLMTLRCS